MNTGTASFGSLQYNALSRTLTTHDSGSTDSGSVSINVVNFQFMLSIHSTAQVAQGNLVTLTEIILSGVTGGF